MAVDLNNSVIGTILGYIVLILFLVLIIALIINNIYEKYIQPHYRFTRKQAIGGGITGFLFVCMLIYYANFYKGSDVDMKNFATNMLNATNNSNLYFF